MQPFKPEGRGVPSPPPADGTHGTRSYDCQYDRMGICALFLLSTPCWVAGRSGGATGAQLWTGAHVLQELINVYFSKATKGILVCDNFNTHTPKSPCKAFDEEITNHLATKLEWCYALPTAAGPT